MKRYLYLSLTPEALISSMLPPQEFGSYLAVGAEKKMRGQAMFFEVDQEMVKDSLPMDYIEKRCVPNEKGEPKKSVYVSVYRVLESIPNKALKNLFLTTHDGRVLELKQGKYDLSKETDRLLHLYQEIAPVTSRIASTFTPSKFLKLITDKAQKVYVPRVVFVQLRLDDLASDPVNGSDENLPYPDIDQLRFCLVELKNYPEKIKKTVIRNFQGGLLYRTCMNGFFVGSGHELLFYPYPEPAVMNETYHVWWRSANAIYMQD